MCKANSCVRVPRRPATTARHYNAAIQANGLVRLDAPRSRESTLQCASVPTGTRICRSGKNDALGYVVDFRHSFRRRTRVTPQSAQGNFRQDMGRFNLSAQWRSHCRAGAGRRRMESITFVLGLLVLAGWPALGLWVICSASNLSRLLIPTLGDADSSGVTVAILPHKQIFEIKE